MKKAIKIITVCLILTLIISVFALPAFAAEEATTAAEESIAVAPTDETNENDVLSAKAIAAAVAIAVVAVGGAIAMGLAISKAVEGIARQPEADGKIRTSLMLGLVFIETAIIYALIVAILIIFVL